MLPSATGYSGFSSYKESPLAEKKLGRNSLNNDYYGKTYLENMENDKKVPKYLQSMSRFNSTYGSDVLNKTKQGSYKPSRSVNPRAAYEYRHNPTLMRFSKVGQAVTETPQPISKKVSCAHWRSEAKDPSPDRNTSFDLSPSRVTGDKPEWTRHRGVKKARPGEYQTEKEQSFGKYGSNPRKLLNNSTAALPNSTAGLFEGSNKSTACPPGYTGFKPKTIFNELALD